jgi:hypothetical protein
MRIEQPINVRITAKYQPRTGVLHKGKSKSPLRTPTEGWSGEGEGEGFSMKKVLLYLLDPSRPSPPAPLPKGEGSNLQNSNKNFKGALICPRIPKTRLEVHMHRLIQPPKHPTSGRQIARRWNAALSR